MKKCPYCAEEIQYEAIVCKHCGRDITKYKKKLSGTTIILAYVLGFFGFPLLFGVLYFFLNEFTGDTYNWFLTIIFFATVVICATLGRYDKTELPQYIITAIILFVPLVGTAYVLFYAGLFIAKELRHEGIPEQRKDYDSKKIIAESGKGQFIEPATQLKTVEPEEFPSRQKEPTFESPTKQENLEIAKLPQEKDNNSIEQILQEEGLGSDQGYTRKEHMVDSPIVGIVTIVIIIIIGIFVYIGIAQYNIRNQSKETLLVTRTNSYPTRTASSTSTPAVRRFPESPLINMDAQSWFQMGIPYLGGLVEGQIVGNDLVYNINLEDYPVLWGTWWCSKSSAFLDENWRNMRLSFSVDGIDVPRGYFQTKDYDNEIEVSGYGKQPAKCRISYLGLYNWPKGNHELVATTHFDSSVFDGWYNTPAGTIYKTMYYVNVKKPIYTTTPDCIMWNQVSEEHEGKFICVIGNPVIFCLEMEGVEIKKQKGGEQVYEYEYFPTGRVGVNFYQTFPEMVCRISPQILFDRELSDFDIKFETWYECVRFWGWVDFRGGRPYLNITKVELCK